MSHEDIIDLVFRLANQSRAELDNKQFISDLERLNKEVLIEKDLKQCDDELKDK